MASTTNEFVVRYLKDMKDIDAVISSSVKKWNRIARNQLKDRLTRKLEVDESSRTGSIAFTVYFTNGSQAAFLFIPPTISTFDLHEEIRDNFWTEIEYSDTLTFNVRTLKPMHQKAVVSASASIVKLMEWSPPRYGSKTKKKKLPKKAFNFVSDHFPKEEIQKVAKEGSLIAEGTNLVRTLAMTPHNRLGSAKFRELAEERVRKLDLWPEGFLDKKKLESLGAGAFLSVMQADPTSKGGIFRAKYRPRRKRNLKKIAIIGKGIVFDTGGHDLKTDEAMIGMHRDMTGAAVALALFETLVRARINAEIQLYLAIAENMISPSAYKSGDVVIAQNGTSIEVVNTDAEGRMCLVDTILEAKKEKPDLIIDFATLTGDIVTAIGTGMSGVFSNDDELGLLAVDAGKNSGERVWNFPVGGDYADSLKSDIADIRQCQTESDAEHIKAATFLMHFVGNKKWIHVDLGCEHREGGLGLVDSDVTGFGVRWGFEFITEYLKKK